LSEKFSDFQFTTFGHQLAIGNRKLFLSAIAISYLVMAGAKAGKGQQGFGLTDRTLKGILIKNRVKKEKIMKLSNTGFIRLTHKIYFLSLAVVFVLAMPVFALHMTEMSKNMQTKVQEPRERKFSLKLPLRQPTFHWTFMSRKDFLSGKLLLRIIRNGESTEIVIFENGKFSEGWEAMPLPQTPDRGEIYFGFISTRKYLTAPGDKLELELTVTKDLAGIGAFQTGILPPGKYASKGTYSGLIDEYDTTLLAEELAKEGKIPTDEQKALLKKWRQKLERKAFLESWTDQWPLKITSQKGWLPDDRASAMKRMLEKLDAEVKPPSSPTDSVGASRNLSQKYLWFWLAVPLVVFFIIVILYRAFAKR